MSITDIQYQDSGIDPFQQAILSGRLCHAYILVGPTGIGKSTTAREFTKILLCDSPRQITHKIEEGEQTWRDSCGKCQSCKLVESGNHPDLHLVYKELIATISGKEAHKATELGIDVIRQEVIDKVGRKATVGRNKVFIIQEAELMSRSAQNALLKTLEEPPENTYIFLVSNQLGVLLPTIRSRAQTLVFKILPESFIIDRLSQAGAEEKESRFLAKFVPGKLGTAMELYRLGVYDLNKRLAKDLEVLEPAGTDDFMQWVIEEAKALAEKMAPVEDSEQIKARISEAEMNRTAVKLILALIGGFCRDSLRYKLKFSEQNLLNSDQMSTVKSLAENYDVSQLQKKILDLGEAEKLIDANVNVTLTVTDVITKVVSH
ncbi:MAG: DNA polymerase III subunit [Phycisphaerae bacterium]